MRLPALTSQANSVLRPFRLQGATGLEAATPGFGVRSWPVSGVAYPHGYAVSVTSERLRSPEMGTNLGTNFGWYAS
jgi:hypothetical protein